MFKDGTWKQEIREKDQIIALTTKLTEMQAKFDQQIALFATQAKNAKAAAPTPSSNSALNVNVCNKHDPYTVAAWRLIKKDTVTVNGREYHWCTGDHYSGDKNTMEYMQTVKQATVLHGARKLMIIAPLVNLMIQICK
jgi:hypothetical protein